MDLTTRTVLIVGGTSGLGLALASDLADAGSAVIVGGRRTELLSQIATDHPAIGTVQIDVTDPASITAARDTVLSEHPALDTVVTMSGIMLPEDLRDPAHLDVAEQTITTNLLGTIRVASAFIPHLVLRGAGTIVTVSSGIAFVPFPLTPTYGATKAGIHHYSESLRAQLAGTGVDVVQLVPPAVATTLMGLDKSPHAMPVDTFTASVVAQLGAEPTPHEITVQRSVTLRNAEKDGTYGELLEANTAALAMLERS